MDAEYKWNSSVQMLDWLTTWLGPDCAAIPLAYCHVTMIRHARLPIAARFGWPHTQPRWTARPDRQAVCPATTSTRQYLAFDGAPPGERVPNLIKAAAVRNGSQWCPNFEAGAFRAVVGGMSQLR